MPKNESLCTRDLNECRSKKNLELFNQTFFQKKKPILQKKKNLVITYMYFYFYYSMFKELQLYLSNKEVGLNKWRGGKMPTVLIIERE